MTAQRYPKVCTWRQVWPTQLTIIRFLSRLRWFFCLATPRRATVGLEKLLDSLVGPNSFLLHNLYGKRCYPKWTPHRSFDLGWSRAFSSESSFFWRYQLLSYRSPLSTARIDLCQPTEVRIGAISSKFSIQDLNNDRLDLSLIVWFLSGVLHPIDTNIEACKHQ